MILIHIKLGKNLMLRIILILTKRKLSETHTKPMLKLNGLRKVIQEQHLSIILNDISGMLIISEIMQDLMIHYFTMVIIN